MWFKLLRVYQVITHGNVQSEDKGISYPSNSNLQWDNARTGAYSIELCYLWVTLLSTVCVLDYIS